MLAIQTALNFLVAQGTPNCVTIFNFDVKLRGQESVFLPFMPIMWLQFGQKNHFSCKNTLIISYIDHQPSKEDLLFLPMDATYASLTLQNENNSLDLKFDSSGLGSFPFNLFLVGNLNSSKLSK